jgi:hypothetical protein
MSRMTSAKMTDFDLAASEMPMRLRYGINVRNTWHSFAFGLHRELILSRLREMGTRIIRIFFDDHAPDRPTGWQMFTGYVQAVLDVNATPMVTFAKLPVPCDSHAVRSFADRCGDVVKRSIQQWGGEAVHKWYWCVGNDPNSEWVSGGLTFEQYRHIYEEAAQELLRCLSPYLGGRKPLIGGPSADGFQPFWIDWVWRFVNEIDNSLIGFASWHRYGDWREVGQWGAPRDKTIFRRLLMARTTEYEIRAGAVRRVLRGRNILNACSELNAHSHHEARVSQQFNETIFGATYYSSALFHLLRGGADIEMFRMGTDNSSYGIIGEAATTTPVFHAKKLFAEHIRDADWMSFPAWTKPNSDVNVVVAHGEDGRQSALLVHVEDEVATYQVSELAGGLGNCRTLLKIDGGTDNRVVETICDGTVSFDGYGIAVLTSEASRE